LIWNDGVVTESNIHYPTDSSLLWDVYRSIARLVTEARRGGTKITSILGQTDVHPQICGGLEFRIVIQWHFNVEKAREKLKSLYPIIE